MKSSNGIFRWMPRVICILAIALISLFAFDAFSEGRSFLQNMGSLFLHLLPSFILIVFLVVSWKRELIGGILFLVTGIVVSPFVYNLNFQRTHSVGASLGVILLMTLPIIVVGVLFILSHFMNKRDRAVENL
jgi:hypothetical protein